MIIKAWRYLLPLTIFPFSSSSCLVLSTNKTWTVSLTGPGELSWKYLWHHVHNFLLSCCFPSTKPPLSSLTEELSPMSSERCCCCEENAPTTNVIWNIINISRWNPQVSFDYQDNINMIISRLSNIINAEAHLTLSRILIWGCTDPTYGGTAQIQDNLSQYPIYGYYVEDKGPSVHA